MNKRSVTAIIALSLSLCGASCLSAAPSDEVPTVPATIAGDIGLSLKGKAWHPKDEDGQEITPVVINGSSYLPVRALAEALGVDIRWDEATRTIVIGGDPAPDNSAGGDGSKASKPDSQARPDAGADRPSGINQSNSGPPDRPNGNGSMGRPNGNMNPPNAGPTSRPPGPGNLSSPPGGMDRPGPGLDPGSPSQSQTNSAHATGYFATTVSDETQLPIGDGYYSTTGPKKGYIYIGHLETSGGGASKDGEWIDKDTGTFDLTKKAVVDGEVNWKSELEIKVEGDKRIITGNRVPDHPTGTFPVSKDDDAYQYDRNPNTIKEKMFELVVPANPVPADKPFPLTYGAIGVMLTGSYIFNGLDAQGKDAVAHEVQDSCYGHPEKDGSYHYHNLTRCIDDPYTGEHSKLVGYAADGFGIYGKYGENGEILTDDDLDEFHGHTHMIEWDGQMVEMYHYHATNEYPYTLGAFKGTPSQFRN
jgi:hypothetical protein